jgi:integrase
MLKPKAAKITIGTFVERYRASDFFSHPQKPNLKEKPLSEGTQYNYRLGLDLMHEQDMTSRSFADLTPQRGNLYIKKVKREHGGAQAGLQKTLLSNLWKFARGFEDFDGGDRVNPMNGGEVETPYKVKQEHLPWPEQVQDDFLAVCDENLYVAFHLLICTGQRVSDVVKMTCTDYDGTHFALVQKKDRSKTPMKIKAPKLLREVPPNRLPCASAKRCDGPGIPTTPPTACARTRASCWPRTVRACRRSWRRSATRRRRWRCTTAASPIKSCSPIRPLTSSISPLASVPSGGRPR